MKIAVFLPNWVGDVVMATAAIRALRNHYPAAHMVGVYKPYVHGLVEGSPWFQRTIFLDKKGPLRQRWPAAALQLGRERIDIAVLFPNTVRSAWVAWLAGCKRRIGFNRRMRGALLTDRLEPLHDEKGLLKPTPIIDDYNRLVEALGCSSPGHTMELFTTPDDEQAANQVWDYYHLGEHAEVICLNPGAAFGSAKHWPAESFAELARELVRRRGCGIVVLCGPGERQLSRQIVSLVQDRNVVSIADHPLSLGLSKAIIRRTTLLVTTDSGPRHIAAAFNRPVVSLFGPTHIEWTDTYYSRASNLQKKVPCGPCQMRVCPLDHRCMKELAPSEVAGAVEQLLATPDFVFGKRKAS